jgi:16S rRNA pseudouridine516 synthase
MIIPHQASLQSEIDKIEERHNAGRLDVDTHLVLITDDGRWTYSITRSDKDRRKMYRVGLSYGITDEKIEALVTRFKQGIQLQGEEQLALPATLEILSPKEVLLTIIEGKYPQVKCIKSLRFNCKYLHASPSERHVLGSWPKAFAKIKESEYCSN